MLTSTTTVDFPSSSSSQPYPSALTTLLATQFSSTQPAPTEALPLEVLHNLRHQHSWTELRLHHRHHHHPKASPAATKAKDGVLQPSISDLDLTCPQSRHQIPFSPAAQPAASCETLQTPPLTLLSGIPPQPVYIHPDLQRKLLKAGIAESSLEPEREWVIPTTLARKWTLRELGGVFDALPDRAWRRVSRGGGGAGGSAMSTSTSTSTFTGESEQSGGRGEGSVREGRGEAGGAAGEATAGKGAGSTATVKHQDAKRVLLAMRAHEGGGGDGTVVYYIVQEGEVKPRQN